MGNDDASDNSPQRAPQAPPQDPAQRLQRTQTHCVLRWVELLKVGRGLALRLHNSFSCRGGQHVSAKDPVRSPLPIRMACPLLACSICITQLPNFRGK